MCFFWSGRLCCTHTKTRPQMCNPHIHYGCDPVASTLIPLETTNDNPYFELTPLTSSSSSSSSSSLFVWYPTKNQDLANGCLCLLVLCFLTLVAVNKLWRKHTHKNKKKNQARNEIASKDSGGGIFKIQASMDASAHVAALSVHKSFAGSSNLTTDMSMSTTPSFSSSSSFKTPKTSKSVVSTSVSKRTLKMPKLLTTTTPTASTTTTTTTHTTQPKLSFFTSSSSSSLPPLKSLKALKSTGVIKGTEGKKCSDSMESSGHGGSGDSEYRPRPGVMPADYELAKLAVWGKTSPDWTKNYAGVLFRLTTRDRLRTNQWLRYDPDRRIARFMTAPGPAEPGIKGALDLWRCMQAPSGGNFSDELHSHRVILRSEGAAQLLRPAELATSDSDATYADFFVSGSGLYVNDASHTLVIARPTQDTRVSEGNPNRKAFMGSDIHPNGDRVRLINNTGANKGNRLNLENQWVFEPDARPLPADINEGDVVQVGSELYAIKHGRRAHLTPVGYSFYGRPTPKKNPAAAFVDETIPFSPEGLTVACNQGIYLMENNTRRGLSGEAWGRLGYNPLPRMIDCDSLASIPEGAPLLK